MSVGFAIQDLATAVVLTQRPSKEISEIVKAEDGDLILPILHIELRVVEDAAEGEGMTAVDPMVDG